jgi:RHS repeat-associated protein
MSSYRVGMSTTTTGAKIFYTINGATPTHNGSSPTGGTLVYSGPITVGKCNNMFFKALAYKSGMTDSIVTTYDADYSGLPNCGGGNFAMMQLTTDSTQSATVTTIIYSVWDGDWAILEEYTTENVLVQKYLQGYHGLVKTFVGAAVYYYQDELGSTSHIASASGALLEYYKYDLYGKPTYWSASNFQLPSSNYSVKDLFTGQRFVTEIGLYDDRNRFMSPDLGRFLQPDPIGFKGDASNLYRYVGNDWANKTDPMGLDSNSEVQQRTRNAGDQNKLTNADNGHTLQESISAWEVEHQANVDSQHSTNMANAKKEALSGAIDSIRNATYTDPRVADKAGATADYKSIQLDRARGIEQKDLTEYYGTVENNGNGTYSLTGPNKGNPAGHVTPGYSSTINLTPNTVGIHYAHPRPADLIHNQPKDRAEVEGASTGRPLIGFVAAPRRGDPNGQGAPIFEGYNGATRQYYRDINKLPDFY